MDEINETKGKTCPADRPPSKKELKEREERQRRGAYFLVGFVVLILFIVAAVLLIPKYLEDNSTPKAQEFYTYNGFEFTKVEGTWYTFGYRGNTQFRISLRNGPKELEDIKVTGDLLKYRSENDFYYVTFDPRDENHDEYVTMSMAEIAPNLRMHFGKSFSAGCIVDHPVCNSSNTSVITCENTDKPVIYLKRQPGAEVTVDGNCAVIKGQGPELVRAADRFLYGMYGIM